MSDPDRRQSAAQYFEQAYELQRAGELKQAIELYTRSIAAFPSAEAYTFRGWAYSLLGDYDRAISECLEAIQVDPDFGNPYNDIGAYLIEQGKWDDSVSWFEKAVIAPRYEARCYPHFNLGRVYEHQHQWQKAKDCYRKAFAIDQRYRVALAGWQRIRAMSN